MSLFIMGELYAALAKAQGEMTSAKEDSANPFFKSKYADLGSIVNASRQALCKYELCVIQGQEVDAEGRLFLYTRLGHSSGQYIESRIPINPPKEDIQSLGSYMTYLRRYCYASLVGVITEDDDGEKNMVASGARNQAPKITPLPAAVDTNANISKEQLSILSNLLKDHGEVLDAVLKAYNIAKLGDLKEKLFAAVHARVVERIREKN